MRSLWSEIVVDNFAGGGGASTGIEMAIGRSVDIAINHDPAAIAMHKVNHPDTEHYCESVWDVDPVQATGGRPVALCWLSPDCQHFSKARGCRPVEKHIRGLAWVALRWAALVRPRVIMLENVEEFQTWGPLIDNRPDPKQKGRTFNAFINALKRHGYDVDFRELRACDYGAPTLRKRFFLIARCDGEPIRWPEPTHGDPSSAKVKSGLLLPWHTAAECIDWREPCPSIFERKKPLVEKTMQRIQRGLEKYVLDNPKPYIVNNTAAYLIQYHSEQSGREVRGQELTRPLLTADASNRYGLCCAFLAKHYGGNYKGAGADLNTPVPTITVKDHNALVEAFLIKYYGQGAGQELSEPLHTITTKDRFGLVVVAGLKYQIADIGMRMLTPRELFRAQGFPESYVIDHDYTGKAYPKSAQVARCGNAVPPPLPAALVRANLPEMCGIKDSKAM